MTTPAGHSLFAVIVFGLWRMFNGRRPWLLVFILAAAFLPDLDYFPLLWGDLHLANLNHQGFTHSILFIVLGCLVISILAKWFKQGGVFQLFPFILASGLSHLLLDYLTYDGRAPVGIPLLWPLDMRFNSPVTIFGGVAKGSLADLLSLHNLFVVGGEILIMGLPALVIWILSERAICRNQNQLDPDNA